MKGRIDKVFVVPNCSYCFREAKLVTGNVIYPHRRDLHHRKFWLCPGSCHAWVGCHPGTDNPLGRLANAELRAAKQSVHAIFDPLWKSGAMKRKDAYAWLAGRLGIHPGRCHVGEFTLEQCSAAVHIIQTRDQLPMTGAQRNAERYRDD